jgi:hypothetical protein
MKGEKRDAEGKNVPTTMATFFRNGSVEERREAYRIVASNAILMQRAVITSAKKLRTESCD